MKMNIKEMPIGSYAKVIKTDCRYVFETSQLCRDREGDLCIIGSIRLRNFFNLGRETFHSNIKNWDSTYTYFEVEVIDENEIDWTRSLCKPDEPLKIGYFKIENTKVIEYFTKTEK